MADVKLTKKEQTIVDSLASPFSTKEIVEKMLTGELTQKCLRYIYESVEREGNIEIDYRSSIIKGGVRQSSTVYIDMSGGPTIEVSTPYVEEDREVTQAIYDIAFLRFNRGTALVGLEVFSWEAFHTVFNSGRVHFVHLPFYESFKEKKKIGFSRHELFKTKNGYTFDSDDIPRVQLKDLELHSIVGEWAILV